MSMMKRNLLIGSAVLLMVLIGVFTFAWLNGNLSSRQGTDEQSRVNKESAQIGTAVGQKAPDFELTDVHNKRFRLSELRGRPTIVYFSTTTCLPCVPETQELAKLKSKYGDNLEVVWMDVDPFDTEENLREYGHKYGHKDFIYALDKPDGKTAFAYKVRVLGTLYLLDPEGIIAFGGIRPVESKKFKEALASLIE